MHSSKNRQAARIGLTVAYFPTVRSFSGCYLHRAVQGKAGFVQWEVYDTVYKVVCIGVLPLRSPSLFLLSQHALNSSFFSSSFLTIILSSCFSLAPKSSPPVVSVCPLIPLLVFLPLSISHTDLIAAIFFQCLLRSSYSFFDSPGKTCWLSQPCTHTMSPSPLSRQRWTQPHQFHLLKRMKAPRLRENQENDFLSFFLIWKNVHQTQTYCTWLKGVMEWRAQRPQEVCADGN